MNPVSISFFPVTPARNYLREEPEETHDRGAQECGFDPRVQRSSSSSSKSLSGVGKVEVVLETGLELVKLLDEWEVM